MLTYMTNDLVMFYNVQVTSIILILSNTKYFIPINSFHLNLPMIQFIITWKSIILFQTVNCHLTSLGYYDYLDYNDLAVGGLDCKDGVLCRFLNRSKASCVKDPLFELLCPRKCSSCNDGRGKTLMDYFQS